MWVWWFMFFSNLILPVILIVSGKMMWKHCSKEINGVIGYRTKRSMKNEDTWKFAHDYCGRLWWKSGWVILIASVLVQIPFYHSPGNVVGTAGSIIMYLQCILMIAAIFRTENALKKTFNDDGTRR